jgi:adenylate cyclase class IV
LANEIELKSVVSDAAALRQALDDAGAVLRFHGMMRDRRLDRSGELSGRDEVLRVRNWVHEDGGHPLAEAAWKGRTMVNSEGYKQREEVEFTVSDGVAALRMLAALGYTITESIDRYVEVYELDGTMVRMEWFPRMDILVEIEGTPEGIEHVIQLSGLDRAGCVADSLATFSRRYQERTGTPGILAEEMLLGAPPSWLQR